MTSAFNKLHDVVQSFPSRHHKNREHGAIATSTARTENQPKLADEAAAAKILDFAKKEGR